MFFSPLFWTKVLDIKSSSVFVLVYTREKKIGKSRPFRKCQMKSPSLLVSEDLAYQFKLIAFSWFQLRA